MGQSNMDPKKEVYSRKHHRTKCWIFQQAMFDCRGGVGSQRNKQNKNCFSPTCQVRASRFYQRYLLLLLAAASSRSQWALPDLNRELEITVGTDLNWPSAFQCHIASSGGCGVALDSVPYCEFMACQRDWQRE